VVGELYDKAIELQTWLDRARYETRAVDNDQAWNEVGVAAGDVLPRIIELAQDPAPPEPPPTPVPNPAPFPDRPGPGLYPQQRYGMGARNWGNLTIPDVAPRGVLLQVHGGGWMQGSPDVASPELKLSPRFEQDAYLPLLHGGAHYGLRVMAAYAAARWGVIVWEPAYTYSTGNPDVCLADVKASMGWLTGKLDDWGWGDLPVVYAGHSAGGQLALRAALDPRMRLPRAFLGMAAAGLSVHTEADLLGAPGGNSLGGTGWIFHTAWGADPSRWPAYAPDTHLLDSGARFPLYIEQGDLGNGDDGSILVRWARKFVQEAQAANWAVLYHEQARTDHFGVRFDQSVVTRTDMDQIWAGG
jgi:hypothetical protein